MPPSVSGARRAAAARRAPPRARLDWAWFFDFDGTLAEIAPAPGAVRVDPALPALLRTLQARTGGAVALITGRAIADVERLLPLDGITIAGQHGLERRDARGRTAAPPANVAGLAEVRERLDEAAVRHPGLVPEFKGLSVALHYRAAPRLAGYAHRLMGALRDRYAPALVLQRGKRVVELRPAGADKGAVVRDLLSAPPFAGRTPLFLGDDVTDESAFRAVNALDGVSVKVGRGPSTAHFRLPGVPDVRAYIRRALEEPR